MRKHHFELKPPWGEVVVSEESREHWGLVPKIQGMKPKTRKQARELRDRLDKVVTDWQHETIRETFQKEHNAAFNRVIGLKIKAYHG